MSSSSRRLRSFKRWMRSQGIDCSDALLLCSSPGEGYSVRAVFPLAQSDVVATIPKTACLTILTSSACRLIQSAALDGWLGLAVALMYERSLGDRSPWAAYLGLLPQRECLPLVWTPHEVDSLLRGTELAMTIEEDKGLMYEDWKENIVPLLESASLDPSFFGAQDYLDARTLIASRSFQIDDYHGFGMVPLADLFNHKTAAEDVHFTSLSPHSDSDSDSDSETPIDEALEMIMVKDVQAGSEVFNTYGSLGNAALLHRYGFTEADNPYDIVNIDLELLLQWSSSLFSRRYSRARLSLWRRLDYTGCADQNTEYFEISFEGEPEIELLILLYIMLLAEDAYHELDLALSNAREVNLGPIVMLLSEKSDIESEERKRVSVFLMTKGVGSALLSLADMRESLYGTSSLEDDIEALRRCCCVMEKKLYHSLMLRISERKILAKLRTFAIHGAKGASIMKKKK
ncbi:hypothetical protein UlMin_029494 [Ulmus minor]